MFRDARALDQERTAASFDKAHGQYVKTAESWFDGTVNSVDRRISHCERLLHAVRFHSARLPVTASASFLKAGRDLEADHQVFADLRDDLLTGGSGWSDPGPAGYRQAYTSSPTTSSPPSFDVPAVPQMPSAVGKKPKKQKPYSGPEGWTDPVPEPKVAVAIPAPPVSAPKQYTPEEMASFNGIVPGSPEDHAQRRRDKQEWAADDASWGLHNAAYPPEAYLRDNPSGKGQSMWDPQANDWAVEDLGSSMTKSDGEPHSWTGIKSKGDYYGPPGGLGHPHTHQEWMDKYGPVRPTHPQTPETFNQDYMGGRQGEPGNANVTRSDARAPGNPTFASLNGEDKRWVKLEGAKFVSTNTDTLADSSELAIRAHNHAARKTSTYSPGRSAFVCEAFVAEVVDLGRKSYRSPIRVATAEPNDPDLAMFL